MRFVSSLLLVVLACLSLSGCNSDPKLYPITGKVTLGGQTHSRLFVYFTPADGRAPDKFNIGVGETDPQGNLKLNSAGGDGVPVGNYKVYFALMVQDNGAAITTAPDQKPDDVNPALVTKNLIPPEYQFAETTPVEFKVASGVDNFFEFDIPLQ